MTTNEARIIAETILGTIDGLEDDIDYQKGFHRYYHENTIENAFGSLHCSVYWGATKCVLVPAEFDYVIKIPFNCQGGKNSVEDAPRFYGARYVLTGEEGEDYCRAEAEVYEAAKAEGLEQFFAETVFAMEYKGLPLYIQPKCEDDDDSKERTSKIETLKSDDAADFSQSYHSVANMSEEMIFNFLVDYGKEKVEQLFCFLDDIEASDFHDGNWAFLNKKAVLIDYASYHEGW